MRTLHRIFGLLFLGILSVPGLLLLHHGQANAERTAEIIRRRPTPIPKAPESWAKAATFPKRFDAWFNDAWGGRERALRTNARLALELFGTSPARELLFGRDRWVFSGESRAIESFAGKDPLTQAQLRAWQRTLEDRHSWLAARGIDHLVVLVPHKSTIYPEKLPPSLDGVRGVSRREQLLAWMRQRSDVQMLDVAPALLGAKPDASVSDTSLRDLYSPLGVHWTPVGAHAAYEQIVSYLAEHHGAPAPHPLEDFNVVPWEGDGDSWSSRMLLDEVISMKNLRLEPKEPTGVMVSRAPGSRPKSLYYSHPDESRPRIVMVHDSFGPAIRPLLAQHASVLDSRWLAWLELEVVEQVKPDIVIELYTELSLVQRLPFRRPEYLSAAIQGQFAKGRVVQDLDVTAPLDFLKTKARQSVHVEDGAAIITVERGVPALRIPPPEGPLSEVSELILRLDIRSERPGRVGIFTAEKLDTVPSVGDMIPLEVGPDSEPFLLPLLQVGSGASTWVFIPPNLGEVTLREAELRACFTQ